jgi:hypothetical protein
VKLTVKQAYERIDKKKIESFEKKGYYLNAVISILPSEKREPQNFIFTFLYPKTNMIIQAIVDDKKVEIKKASKAGIPTLEKLDLKKLKVFHKTIIKKSLDIYKKNIKESFSQMILAVERHEWKVTFITKTLNVFIIVFDMSTGKMMSTKKESLISIDK